MKLIVDTIILKIIGQKSQNLTREKIIQEEKNKNIQHRKANDLF